MKKFKPLALFLAVFFQTTEIFANPASNKFQTTSLLSSLDGSASGNHYNRKSFSNSIEYNLPYKMSIGTNFQLSYIDSHYQNTEKFVWNYIDLWHRYRFFDNDNFRLTVQNLYKRPGNYDVNKNIGLGAKQEDYELRLLADYHAKEGLTNSIVHHSTSYMLRLEIGYRRRFSNPYDEIRSAFTAFYNVNNDWSLLLQSNATWNVFSSRKAGPNDNSFNNFGLSNDANTLTTFSGIYHLNDKAALQFGYVRKLAGKSTTHDDRGFVLGLLGAF